MSDNENGKNVSRRTLLGTTAAAAGVGLAGGIALGTDGTISAADAQTKTAAPPKAPAARPAVLQKAEVAPGELDEYYTFFSSGQLRRVAAHRDPGEATRHAGSAAASAKVARARYMPFNLRAGRPKTAPSSW